MSDNESTSSENTPPEEAWNALLTRFGYSESSREYLGVHGGVTSPTTLSRVRVSKMNSFLRDLSRQAQAMKLPAAQEGTRPTFPHVPNECLRAFRLYLEWQLLAGQGINDTIDCESFDNEELTKWRDHLDTVDAYENQEKSSLLANLNVKRQ